MIYCASSAGEIKMTKTISTIIVLALITLCGGCIGNSAPEFTEVVPTQEIATPVPTPTEIPTPVVTPTPIVVENQQIYTDNTSVGNGEMIITVAYISKHNAWDHKYSRSYPADGHIYIAAIVTIKNIDNARGFYGSNDISMTDSLGYRYDPEHCGEYELEYIQELYEGQQMQGIVLFEVPSDASGLLIQYDANSYGDPHLISWEVD